MIGFIKPNTAKLRVILAGISVLVVLTGLLGFKFGWWSSNLLSQPGTQNHSTAENSSQPTKDGSSFISKKQGLSFLHPKDWSVKEEGEGTVDAPYYITLKSNEIEEKNLGDGGSEVTKGARVNILIGKTEGKNLEQIYRVGITGIMIENGSIKPEQIKINDKEGVEFSIAFDGPQTRTVHYLYDQNNYVSATLETAGQEQRHPGYSVYKQILASLRIGQ